MPVQIHSGINEVKLDILFIREWIFTAMQAILIMITPKYFLSFGYLFMYATSSV